MFEWITDTAWRRILRAGLEKHIGVDGVTEAIQFWHANFEHAKDRQKHVRPFAQAFTEFIGKPEMRTAFALQIIAAMHTKLDTLPADLVTDLDLMTRTDSTKAFLSPLHATLTVLIKALRQGFYSKVFDPALRVKFDQSCVLIVSGDNTKLQQDDAIQLVSSIYIVLTDILGPVEADTLLSLAVKQVETTPQGQAFSPRLLL